MLLFQATGEKNEKMGVVVSKQPNEFVKGAEPVMIEVITFNADSPQAKSIESAQKNFAEAKEAVVSSIKELPLAEQAKAFAQLEKFEKAAGAVVAEWTTAARHGTNVTPELTDKKIYAEEELRKIVGEDAYSGKTPVTNLAAAAKKLDAATFEAVSSVTPTNRDGLADGQEKLNTRKEAGSEMIRYEKLPASGTRDASGPAQPINPKVGGTLNSRELENIGRSYKAATQQPEIQQKGKVMPQGQ